MNSTMKLIQRKLELQPIDYYIQHLSIINILLDADLKRKEIEVLSHFMNLDKHLTEDDMFNTEARKRVKKSLELSAGGLSNHLKSLIKKKILLKHKITGKITIQEFLFPEENNQGFQIRLIKQN